MRGPVPSYPGWHTTFGSPGEFFGWPRASASSRSRPRISAIAEQYRGRMMICNPGNWNNEGSAIRLSEKAASLPARCLND
jgi:hypothetical protein